MFFDDILTPVRRPNTLTTPGEGKSTCCVGLRPTSTPTMGAELNDAFELCGTMEVTTPKTCGNASTEMLSEVDAKFLFSY